MTQAEGTPIVRTLLFDVLGRESLHEAAAELGLADLPASVLDDLALAGQRLRAWPRPSPAESRLRRHENGMPVRVRR
jgi:hypothetical protein